VLINRDKPGSRSYVFPSWPGKPAVKPRKTQVSNIPSFIKQLFIQILGYHKLGKRGIPLLLQKLNIPVCS